MIILPLIMGTDYIKEAKCVCVCVSSRYALYTNKTGNHNNICHLVLQTWNIRGSQPQL